MFYIVHIQSELFAAECIIVSSQKLSVYVPPVSYTHLSISAFCNAGFDLMGINEEYSSFTKYVADPLVNITIMLLLIIGGIGFTIWNEMCIRDSCIHYVRDNKETVFAQLRSRLDRCV